MNTRRALGAVVLLALALAVGTAGWGSLYNETDGQYGGAAKVMASGGDWLIPENNGVPRLVKPPLLYWAMASAMKIFGVNEFAARLPGALSVAGWAAVTCLIAAHRAGAWRGFLAGAILLTSLGSFTLGRIVMPEPTFSLFVAGAIYCLLRGEAAGHARRGWFLGFWLCAALAGFTKGWHGLLYPLTVAGVAAAACPAARPNLRGLVSWAGVGIFLAINLPWYAYLEARFPGYVSNLFFAEHLGHLTGSGAPATRHGDVPRGVFVLLHAAWFLPWSIVAAVGWIFRRRDTPVPRPDRSFFDVVLIAWGVLVFVSVLLTGERQDYYAMSMWPVVAIGLAAVIDSSQIRAGAVVAAVVFLVGLGAAVFLQPAAGATATVAERDTALTTVMNFDGSVWARLRPTAWLTLSAAAALCLVAGITGGRRGQVAIVAAAGCLDIGAVAGTALVAPYFSLAAAASEIVRHMQPGGYLVYDGGLDTGSSLLFYTDLPVTLVGEDPEEDFVVRTTGQGRDRFVTPDEFAALWTSATPIVLVTEAAAVPEWESRLGPLAAPAARSGTQVVLINFRGPHAP